VVAAVEYTPAAPFVVFPDGRVEMFQTERFNVLSAKPEGLQYEKLQIEGGARAISPGVLSFAADDGRRSTARIGFFLRPIPASQVTNVSQLLASLPPGTLLATPSSPGFAHMSFSDLLLLRAGPNAEARAAPLRNLALVRAFTRSFFDQALRGAPSGPASLPIQGYSELKIETAADRPVTTATPSALARPAPTPRPARTS
jgi:hypothetical protein